MKVSRKAGRRSRSSVSCRKLRNKKSRSGYRKKHTQRGGKYGKRSRGHKRARTYKRGKKFHRGGMFNFFKSHTTFDDKTGVITNLKYTKIKPNKTTSEKVNNFNISVNRNEESYFTIVFYIISKNNIPFAFTFGPDTLSNVIDTMTRSFTEGNTITNSSDISDNAKYQLNLDNESLVDRIKQYIYDKAYILTAPQPAKSIADFFIPNSGSDGSSSKSGSDSDSGSSVQYPFTIGKD